MGDANYSLEPRNIIPPLNLPKRYYLPGGTHTGFYRSRNNPEDTLCFANFIPKHAEHALIVEVGTGHIAEDWSEMMRVNTQEGIATFVRERFSHGLSSRAYEDPGKLGARPFSQMADNQAQFITDVVRPMLGDYGIEDISQTVIGGSQGALISTLCAHQNPGLIESMALIVPMMSQHDLARKIKHPILARRHISKEAKRQGLSEPTADMIIPTDFQKLCDEQYENLEGNRTALKYRDPEYNPDLACNAVTLGWVEEGEKGTLAVRDPSVPQSLDMPVLAITVHKDDYKKRGGDRCTDNGWTQKFIDQTPNGALVTIEDADHDIMNERLEVRTATTSYVHELVRDPQGTIDKYRPQPQEGRRIFSLALFGLGAPSSPISPPPDLSTPVPTESEPQVVEPSSV